MSVINSFTQHTINLTRKALRLGSDFVHPVHDDTPDEPDYLSNADVPVETNIALPHSDDWDDGHLTVTDIDPATGLLTTSTEGAAVHLQVRQRLGDRHRQRVPG